MFAVLAGDSRVRDSKAGQDFLRQLVVLVGAKNQPEEVADVLKFVGKADEPALTFAMTRALGDGLQRQKHPSPPRATREASWRAKALQRTTPARGATRAGHQPVYTQAMKSRQIARVARLKQPQPVQLAALSTRTVYGCAWERIDGPLEHIDAAPARRGVDGFARGLSAPAYCCKR
jgi:hypothetical protein